jgi:hypothetical protein
VYRLLLKDNCRCFASTRWPTVVTEARSRAASGCQSGEITSTAVVASESVLSNPQRLLERHTFTSFNVICFAPKVNFECAPHNEMYRLNKLSRVQPIDTACATSRGLTPRLGGHPRLLCALSAACVGSLLLLTRACLKVAGEMHYSGPPYCHVGFYYPPIPRKLIRRLIAIWPSGCISEALILAKRNPRHRLDRSRLLRPGHCSPLPSAFWI